MSGKRLINKNHPDYPAYIEKCRKLGEEYDALCEKERAKYPNWRGLDHPADFVILNYLKEHNRKLKELKKEYDYLFTTKE